MNNVRLLCQQISFIHGKCYPSTRASFLVKNAPPPKYIYSYTCIHFNTATKHKRSCSYGNYSSFYCSHLYTKSVLEIYCDEKGYLFTLVQVKLSFHTCQHVLAVGRDYIIGQGSYKLDSLINQYCILHEPKSSNTEGHGYNYLKSLYARLCHLQAEAVL